MDNFHSIKMETWPMAQAFHYYTQIAPTSYTVNVSVDVTVLRRELKTRAVKFFPAYLYLVTKAIAEQQELRMAVKDGILGYWDSLTPAYPQFHEDDKTTSLLWTEFNQDFTVFYHQYICDTGLHGNSHGILSSKGVPPPNAYIISCIPWFTYQSFSLHNHGIKDYYVPSFEAGGFTKNSSGQCIMPLSITVHHGVTEGYHLKIFFQRLQDFMNHPKEWLQ